jgi:hypothetical protein
VSERARSYAVPDGEPRPPGGLLKIADRYAAAGWRVETRRTEGSIGFASRVYWFRVVAWSPDGARRVDVEWVRDRGLAGAALGRWRTSAILYAALSWGVDREDFGRSYPLTAIGRRPVASIPALDALSGVGP